MRVANREGKFIGFRLNILGVRVWHDHCRLVAKDASGNWTPLGPSRSLPVLVPSSLDEIGSDPLVLTAYQYEHERPGSDLYALLSQTKDFDRALLDSDGSGEAGKPNGSGAR